MQLIVNSFAEVFSNLETFKDYFELRDHVKAYREDDVDLPRFG